MKIYRNRWFAQWARQQSIADSDLCEAIGRANRGLVDADLGSGVIKQRISRPNQGKSGGFRTIIFFRVGARAFFIFGFAKSERENLSKPELKEYKALAKSVLAYTEDEIQVLLDNEKLTEVNCDDENLQE